MKQPVARYDTHKNSTRSISMSVSSLESPSIFMFIIKSLTCLVIAMVILIVGIYIWDRYQNTGQEGFSNMNQIPKPIEGFTVESQSPKVQTNIKTQFDKYDIGEGRTKITDEAITLYRKNRSGQSGIDYYSDNEIWAKLIDNLTLCRQYNPGPKFTGYLDKISLNVEKKLQEYKDAHRSEYIPATGGNEQYSPPTDDTIIRNTSGLLAYI
jgi:hypothetical protein